MMRLAQSAVKASAIFRCGCLIDWLFSTLLCRLSRRYSQHMWRRMVDESFRSFWTVFGLYSRQNQRCAAFPRRPDQLGPRIDYSRRFLSQQNAQVKTPPTLRKSWFHTELTSGSMFDVCALPEMEQRLYGKRKTETR